MTRHLSHRELAQPEDDLEAHAVREAYRAEVRVEVALREQAQKIERHLLGDERRQVREQPEPREEAAERLSVVVVVVVVANHNGEAWQRTFQIIDGINFVPFLFALRPGFWSQS